MPCWTADAPARLDFDVTALQVRLTGGTVAVLATAGCPSIVVSDITGRPSRISYDAGPLRLPADSDARGPLHSTSGNAGSEFGSLPAVLSPGSHTVSGSLGDGSGNVSVHSVCGAVTLPRRPVRRTTPRAEPPRAEAELESETR